MNIYAEFAPKPAPGANAIFHASNDGKRAFIARADVAALIAAVAVDAPKYYNRGVYVTGAEAYSSSDLAQIYSELTNQPIQANNQTVEQYINGLIQHGIPEPFARAYEVITSQRLMDVISNDYEKVVGRKPQSFREFLAQKIKQ